MNWLSNWFLIVLMSGLVFLHEADSWGQSNLQNSYWIHSAGTDSPIDQYQNTHDPGWQYSTVPPQPDPQFIVPPTMPAAENILHRQRMANAAIRAARHVRAGCPLATSKRATTTYDSNYQGYYVGGGVPNGRRHMRGEPRYLDEGIWGMDYAPLFSRVASSWSHGRLFQGGIGQYEPDRKNRPFGQTFGKHFGRHESRFDDHNHPGPSPRAASDH